MSDRHTAEKHGSANERHDDPKSDDPKSSDTVAESTAEAAAGATTNLEDGRGPDPDLAQGESD